MSRPASDMLRDDTIAAIATPPGRGGVGIIRISGPAAAEIGKRLSGVLPAPRRAVLARFGNIHGEALDEGLVLFFPGPHSFTGEDVVELHGHGGPVVLDLLLQSVLAAGARHAEAGEFSRRAYLNDKLDLTQAEAIADLIDSGSAAAARAALNSLRGEFSARVHRLVEMLTDLRSYVEAAIDFPDEDVDFLSDKALERRCNELDLEFSDLRACARQGSLLREGMSVVIAGPPNAGKSSLLNALAGYEAAIVTEVPGTTRDVLREQIAIDGLPLHVIDTAGLRETRDRVEIEGIRRARAELERADRALILVDATADWEREIRTLLDDLASAVPATLIVNKIDLLGAEPRIESGAVTRVYISALTGAGIDLLREHLKACIGFEPAGNSALSARRRHLDALVRGEAHFREAVRQLADFRAGELMAEELRLAQQALAEITGEFGSEDLLGRIFSSFCIGK
ncbi:MAG: tRNA uridine-5-carboxymethylaminomethyl(34) synthesis GTPase MnmE [Chromatiales bacterium]|jgi:tRNA modification GTPase